METRGDHKYKFKKSPKISSSKVSSLSTGESKWIQKKTWSWFLLKSFSEQQLRDSPRSPGGLSPSRSRSVWPFYPRIHLASPRRPATPRPVSHSETAKTASSESWQSNEVTYAIIGTHIMCLYLQHEHHSLHNVPLRLSSIHDHGETPSLALLTKGGGGDL